MTSAVELTSKVSDTHRGLHGNQKRWEKLDTDESETYWRKSGLNLSARIIFATRVECFELDAFGTTVWRKLHRMKLAEAVTASKDGEGPLLPKAFIGRVPEVPPRRFYSPPADLEACGRIWSCSKFIRSCRRRHPDLNFAFLVRCGYEEQLKHRRRAAVVSTWWRCVIPTDVVLQMSL